MRLLLALVLLPGCLAAQATYAHFNAGELRAVDDVVECRASRSELALVARRGRERWHYHASDADRHEAVTLAQPLRPLAHAAPGAGALTAACGKWVMEPTPSLDVVVRLEVAPDRVERYALGAPRWVSPADTAAAVFLVPLAALADLVGFVIELPFAMWLSSCGSSTSGRSD